MLEYTLYPNSEDPVIMSGWGLMSDWLKNLQKDPHVEVRIGKNRFSAIAEPLTDQVVAERLDELFKAMPRMKKMLETRDSITLDGSREKMLEMASRHPSFRLRREGGSIADQ